MTARLRAIGVALSAVLVLGVIGVPGSPATEIPQFTGATEASGEGEGAGSQVFHLFGTEVSCARAQFDVQVPELAAKATAQVQYSNCEVGGLPATVNTTNCDYLLTVSETDPTHDYSGTLDVQCEEAGQIDITVYPSSFAHEAENPICHFGIAAQSGLASVKYSNTGEHVDVTGEVTGMTAVQESTSILCPAGVHATTVRLAIEIPVTLKGMSEEGESVPFHIG